MGNARQHSENMPILYRNIMYGLSSDFERDVFLWASEQTSNDPHLYKAEGFAREVSRLIGVLGCLLAVADRVAAQNGTFRLDADQVADLTHFMMTRHANWRLGANKKPPYAEAAP